MNNEITTCRTSFGARLAGRPLFTVLPGIPLQDALEQPNTLLGPAIALSAETVDADLALMQSLNQAILHVLEKRQGADGRGARWAGAA